MSNCKWNSFRKAVFGSHFICHSQTYSFSILKLFLINTYCLLSPSISFKMCFDTCGKHLFGATFYLFPKFCRWSFNFLAEWTIQVVIDWLILEHDSALAQTLFLFHINDLSVLATNCSSANASKTPVSKSLPNINESSGNESQG